MRLSKHHYAVTLAEKGNTVFFIEPPVFRGWFRYQIPVIRPSGSHPSLFVISSSLRLPYFFKFHFKRVFYYFIKRLLRSVSDVAGGQPDIIWSFDLSDVFPLRFFNRDCFRIFHPVDMPLTDFSFAASGQVDVIFSTSEDILDQYAFTGLPSFFIDHGLSEEFLRGTSDDAFTDDAVRIGYAGNLLRHDIDRPVLLQIIKENPDVIFECWGSCGDDDRNLGGVTDDLTKLFIRELRNSANVILHGSVSPEVLAQSYFRMNGFLICYDLDAVNPIGPNYHKLMEFFSSGKVVISSYVKHYAQRPELIQMVDRGANNSLPDLFKSVLADLSFHNSAERMASRREWAFSNTYRKQIERIEKLLDPFN